MHITSKRPAKCTRCTSARSKIYFLRWRVKVSPKYTLFPRICASRLSLWNIFAMHFAYRMAFTHSLFAHFPERNPNIIQSLDRSLIKIFNVSRFPERLLKIFVDFSLFGFCISLSHQRYTKFAIFRSEFSKFECYNEGTNFKNKTGDERRQRNVIVGERFHEQASISSRREAKEEAFYLKSLSR